jgi:hypothetical protein
MVGRIVPGGLERENKLHIPRSSSPRQRGYGRLGMTKGWGMAARLKSCPPKGCALPKNYHNLV